MKKLKKIEKETREIIGKDEEKRDELIAKAQVIITNLRREVELMKAHKDDPSIMSGVIRVGTALEEQTAKAIEILKKFKKLTHVENKEVKRLKKILEALIKR